MDTRLLGKKKQDDNQVKSTSVQDLDDQNVIIRTDKIDSDKAYHESIIFNLVRRFDHLDYLEQKYQAELEKVETTPKWAKYYFHNSIIAPGTVIIFALLKYKKKLTMHTGCAVACFASLLNEFSRSRKVRKLGKEKVQEYDEYTENYNLLFRHYVGTIKFKDVLKYGIGIDLDKNPLDWRRHMYNEKLNHEFIQDLYF